MDALRDLCLLDTAPDERFDRVTRSARQLFNVPMALVSLVDEKRQWFKSAQGLEARETPRAVSFCAHAIAGSELLVVEDAQRDARFADNPLVTGEPWIRFYAGCPISTSSGSQVGTLCLLDKEPRRFSDSDRTTLRALAGLVESELAGPNIAINDTTTGLANKEGLISLGRYVFSHHRRNRQSLQLLHMRVHLDARLAEPALHATLVSLIKELKTCFRGSDLVARIGKRELAVLLSCSPQVVGKAIDRVNKVLQAFNGQRCPDQGAALAFTHVSCDFHTHSCIDELVAAAASVEDAEIALVD